MRGVILLGLAATVSLAGFSLSSMDRVPISDPPCGSPNANCSSSEQQDVFVQFVFQPNSPELAQLTGDVLNSVSRRVRGRHLVELSLLAGTGDVHVFHSGKVNRNIIRRSYEQLDSDSSSPGLTPTPSTEKALVSGVLRLRERVKYSSEPQELYFYLVTQGTSNPEILNQIRAITGELANHDLSRLHVYLIGVSPEHRIAFSDAFSPIRQVVKSATSQDGEWKPLIQNF